MKWKRIRKRFVIAVIMIGLLIAGLFVVYKIFFDPYRGTTQASSSSLALSTTFTKAQALEDLSFILTKFKERHPACIDEIPVQVQEQFDIEASILSDDTTTLELWQSSSRILAKMKDAHTGVGYYGEDLSRLALTFDIEDSELFCTSEGYENYIVESINGVPWNDLYQTYLNQFSYELENYAVYRFEEKLPNKNFLAFIGIDTSSDIKITFLINKEAQEIPFAFEVPAAVEMMQTGDVIEEESFVSYQIDKDLDLGILTLLSCDYNDYYCKTLKQFFTEVKNNNISFVAVDLRNNGGGNSMVANEFMRYLDLSKYYVSGGVDVRYGSFLMSFNKSITKNKKFEDLLFTGKVYALTSDETFSSAKMFANILLDNHIGELIGEIPGNMPASYGDILLFQTPNAKLPFTVSFKYFGRIDETKADIALIPNYKVKSEDAITKLHEIINN